MYNLELLEKSSAKATIELKGEEFKKVRIKYKICTRNKSFP